MGRPTRALLVVSVVGLAAVLGPRTAAANPPPPKAEEPERWIGLRVQDADLRLRAVADTKAPLNQVADALPFLVIALDDEAAPVRAAVRERIRELAGEAVDPILDALQAARPGRKAGAFGALSALGTSVTPVEIAVAAGALAPVNPPDRREAALVLALPAATPPTADRARLAAAQRLAALLLADTDAQVRRAAAAAGALVALQQARASEMARQDPGVRRALRLSLSKGQQERVVELMAHGSADIAAAAAGLAGRFEDASPALLEALVALLEKADRRDAAALAIADLGEGAVTAGAALAKHPSYGTWRALLRLRHDEAQVLDALKGADKVKRRLAAAVALAERRGAPEAVEALLPELEAAFEDGRFEDVLPWLRRVAEWGPEARPALPALRAFVEAKEGDPHAKDLAAAVAFGIDRSQAWAAQRVEGLLAVAEANDPTRLNPHQELAVATALAVWYADLKDAPSVRPAALTRRRLAQPTLTGTLVVTPLTGYVARGDKDGAHVALLLTLLGEPGAPPHGAAPTLRALAERGQAGEDLAGARWLALTVLAVVPDLSAEHRRVVDALHGASDPWLRHRAAQLLRQRWPA